MVTKTFEIIVLVLVLYFPEQRDDHQQPASIFAHPCLMRRRVMTAGEDSEAAPQLCPPITVASKYELLG